MKYLVVPAVLTLFAWQDCPPTEAPPPENPRAKTQPAGTYALKVTISKVH